MKKTVFMMLVVLLLFTLTTQIRADTIIDTIYAIGSLTGTLIFSQTNQSISFNDYVLLAGDEGEPLQTPPPPDPNSRFRSYISFELPDIPHGYNLDSAYIRLYQVNSWGNSIFNEFPIWDVPGGDTMFCIMDHIDYGNYIDPGDWTAGDFGDPGTLCSNIGIISDSAEAGHRYLEITDYVLDDYMNSRNKTQYRIRFPIETDWDSLYDYIYLRQGSTPNPTNPGLILYLTSPNPIYEQDISNSYNTIEIYPNPFIGYTTIKFNSDISRKSCSTKNQIKIYNIKGKLVKCISAAQINWKGGENKVIWDGRDKNGNIVSNGLYLIKIEGKDVNVIRKVLKLY